MFIMLPPLLYGQNKLVEESIIYSSDISSYKKEDRKKLSFLILRPTYQFFELILDTARSSKMYTSYYFRKRLREVSTEISYIGGNESLRKYQVVFIGKTTMVMNRMPLVYTLFFLTENLKLEK